MIDRNFHTHTVFCDGKSEPEEIVLSALDAGMAALGFSGHAHTAFDESYAMSHETAREYRRVIRGLQKKYADRIEILCGAELDLYSDADPAEGGLTAPWDYTIGSVHYLHKDGEYVPMDESAETTRKAAKRLYGGDTLALAEDFFAEEAEVAGRTGCDIIGHFDLLTKFEECGEPVFDRESPRYRNAWMSALDALIPYGKPFEINTGAISRGYRKTPYPYRDILEEIKRRGGCITFSSDSHEKSTLLYGFDEAEKLARDIGFRSYIAMSRKGPIEIGL
jgi:histidinol-phosphatase (PHP family)